MTNKSSQSGQLLLIVILVMVVVLTVALSLASRTVSNIKISKQNEESQRAFQAAEAGIESQAKSLQYGFEGAEYDIQEASLSNNSSFSTDKTEVVFEPNVPFLLNNGSDIDQNIGIDVWLSTYPGNATPFFNGQVTIYWAVNEPLSDRELLCTESPATKREPAIELIVLSKVGTEYKIRKKFLDSSNCASTGRTSSTATTPASASGETFPNSIQFRNKYEFNGIIDGIVMKVVPLFNSGIIGLVYTGTPASLTQGTLVTSIGKAGDTARKLVYFESNPQIPVELFQYAVISQDQ